MDLSIREISRETGIYRSTVDVVSSSSQVCL